MPRLFLIVYAMAAPTLAGSLIVAALVAGLDTLRPIVVAAAIGFAAALPAAWAVARRLEQGG